VQIVPTRPNSLGARLTPGQGSPTPKAFGLTDRGIELTTYWRLLSSRLRSRLLPVLTADGEVFAVTGEDLNHVDIWRGHVICISDEQICRHASPLQSGR